MNEVESKITAQQADTTRLNAEHAKAVLLATPKWEEFKAGFRQQCESITRTSGTTFSCADPSETLFQIYKVVRGTLHRAIDFRFHPEVPAISFTHHFHPRAKTGVLDMAMCGPNLLFSNGPAGVVLIEFITECMIPLVGW